MKKHPLLRPATQWLCAIPLATMLAATPTFAAEKPVKVYILAGQSNMVGIGQVVSSGNRWGGEFTDATVSIYEGEYDASKDYSSLDPIETKVMENTTKTPEPTCRSAKPSATPWSRSKCNNSSRLPLVLPLKMANILTRAIPSLGKSGRLVVPKAIRESLGLHEGSRLKMEVESLLQLMIQVDSACE